MGDKGNMGNHGNKEKPKADLPAETQRAKAGYEYLLAYKITVPIYDYTIEFCSRWIPRTSRTFDQMVQAARSGVQNISEDHQQQGLKGYIKLAGVSRGSLEELLNDYAAYVRQHRLAIYSREKSIREIREIIRKTPTFPNHPHLLDLFDNSEKAGNLMITLLHQANYLVDKLIASLKERHRTQGGLTEQLYQARRTYRGY